MCLQISLTGQPWDLGGTRPVDDQHYWGRLSEKASKEEKHDVTDASKIDEKK